jgi:hypothetical protein
LLRWRKASAQFVQLVSPPKDLDRAERGDRRRLLEKRAVGVPPAPEQAGGLRLGFLDDRVHLAVARHSLGVGIDREGAEPGTERLVLGMRQVLVAQKQHLVAVERLFEVFERLIGHVRQPYPGDLRTHRPR